MSGPIRLLRNGPRSAVQDNAKLGEPMYVVGDAGYFGDKAAFPKGTPRDGKINVIRNVRGSGTVIARVDSLDAAFSRIREDSGRRVKVVAPSFDDDDERAAEGKAS